MHIWANNSIIKQLQVHSVNVTSIEVELMAICTGLISTIEIDNIHDITVITDSIAAARKILEFKVDLFQNMFIPLAFMVKTFLSKDSRNKIHFWYCPAKPNGLDTSLLMTKSKQAHAFPLFPAKSHTYSAKRKSVTTPSVNGKCLLPTASKKAITF